MNVGVDISPLKVGHFLQHRVRGTGFYVKSLLDGFKRYHPENNYRTFVRGESIREKLDILHFPYFEPFFLTLPFVKRYSSIVTVHDLTPLVFPDHFPPGIKGSIKWLIQKQLLIRMDCVITDSNSSKNDILKFTNLPEDRVYVVYLCVDSAYKPITLGNKTVGEMRNKYSLPDKFALYVGDVTWNKNLPRLIDAVAQTGIPFVMVGKALVEKKVDSSNPWNQDLLKARLQLEQNDKIYTIGFVPTQDLVSLYNMATLFVMPSLYEGFGLPVLEAMASGCPVVTSRRGSIEEVGGDAVYYVNPLDAGSIKDGVLEVYNNKKLQNKLREKGYAQSKKFGIKKMVDDTIDVYKKIIH